MHLIKLNFICPALGGGLQTGLFKFLFVRRVEYPDACVGVRSFYCLFFLYSQAAFTNSRNKGPALFGRLLNSGWNWPATIQG